MIAGGLCRSNFFVHRPVGISPNLIDKEKIVTYGLDEALIESEKQPNTDVILAKKLFLSFTVRNGKNYNLVFFCVFSCFGPPPYELWHMSWQITVLFHHSRAKNRINNDDRVPLTRPKGGINDWTAAARRSCVCHLVSFWRRKKKKMVGRTGQVCRVLTVSCRIGGKTNPRRKKN